MSERQGIEIDYCPRCRGVWLDRGELDKIIARAGAESEPVSPRSSYDRGDDRDYRHGYGHRKKKRGFLSEVFDSISDPGACSARAHAR
jgi:Zn-finger nucleic acid-binding protein